LYSILPLMPKFYKLTLYSLLLCLGAIGVSYSFFDVVRNYELYIDYPQKSRSLILMNLFVISIFIIVIAGRLISLKLKKDDALKSFSFRNRIIVLFCLISIIPSVVIASFSASIFNLGIKSWFNERVSSALNNSLAVAEGYLEEHKKNIRTDVLVVVTELNRISNKIKKDDKKLAHLTSVLAGIRKIPNADIIRYDIKKAGKDNNGLTILDNGEKFFIAQKSFTDALNGEVILLNTKDKSKVRALAYVSKYPNTYLLASRSVDSKVLSHMEQTKDSVNEYRQLKNRIAKGQILFLLFFALISFTMVLVSLWAGILIAVNISQPIIKVVEATKKISEGDYNFKIVGEDAKSKAKNNEISLIAESFDKMTQKILQQQQELKKSTWADLARKIAHEIKNPLTPIKLALDRINNAPQEKKLVMLEKYLDTINRQINTIGNIVEEFDEFARMSPAKFKKVDIIATINTAINLFKNLDSRVKISFSYDAENLFISADEGHLLQVFNNLIKNSFEAIEGNSGGNGGGEISIRLENKNNQVLLSISDNGGGIPETLLNKITEPYVTSKEKGTGLGLAIVKRIIEEHKGKFSIHNIYDGKELVGAKMDIELPA